MSWECIPHICHSGLKSTTEKLIQHCKNMPIQSENIAPVEVKTGSYGLGVFATSNIMEGAYIGEYVAEELNKLDYSKEANSRFVKLNYRFDHSAKFTLDAMHAGNFSRFINHEKSPKENAFGQIKMVAGEQRIGFFADKKILKGQEVTFDYGDGYWKSHGDHGEAERNDFEFLPEDQLEDEQYSD